MPDKQTPTDAELKAMWQIHAADIGGIFYYARAVLAKWGQPAKAAEPVAAVVPCYTPSGKRVALCSAKQDLPIGTKLYAAPQPPTAPATQQGAADGFFLLLPQRPKPEAPAGTAGLDWDTYSGAQMLAFGRDCSDAAIAALRTERPAPSGATEEVENLRKALVYAAFALHDTPRYMLAQGITLIDGDTVRVSRDGWTVEASVNPHRQPAPATVGVEPVALLVRKNSWRDGQWEAAPPNSPSYGLAWANQRVYVYTTPQPTQPQAGAVPLTDEQIRAMLNKHPPEDVCGWSYRMGIDDAELHHGIKGGHHVVE